MNISRVGAVILVKLELLAELRHTELDGLPLELFQNVQRMGNRLDDVVGFFSLYHDKKPRFLDRHGFRVCINNVIYLGQKKSFVNRSSTDFFIIEEVRPETDG